MFKIVLSSFDIPFDVEFNSLEKAIEFAKQKGFDSHIYYNNNIIGHWSIIGGYRNF